MRTLAPLAVLALAATGATLARPDLDPNGFSYCPRGEGYRPAAVCPTRAQVCALQKRVLPWLGETCP